jgi:hypothetical protein
MTLNALRQFQISQTTKSINMQLKIPYTDTNTSTSHLQGSSNLQHLTMINKKFIGILEPSHILIINTININYSSSLQSSIPNNN